MSPHVALALLLPAGLGAGLWLWIAGWPRDRYGAIALAGAAYLVGAVAWGALLGGFESWTSTTLFARLAPWLAILDALLIGAAWRWAPRQARVAAPPASRRERLLMGAIALLLGATFVALAVQASALPSLSWDAWNAWLAKSKGWYHAGSMQPVLGFDAWLASAPGNAITTTAPEYPEALPRLAVWLASAAGSWSEPAVHAAWPLAWAALGAALFGGLVQAQVRPRDAALATGFLLTLPLPSAHAALAGYADLWLAALVLLGGLQLHRWQRARGPRPLLALLLLAGLALATKMEGAVWFATLFAALGLMALPRRLRWSLLLAAPLLYLLALPFGGLRLPVPGLGLVRFDWGLIEIPVRGTLALSWRPVADEVVQALFLLPNWSLLWYAAPLLLAWRAGVLRQRAELAALGWSLAFGCAFLFVLFFLTDAAAWAENFTSVNRVLLHAVPLTVAWLTLLWTSPRDTAPSRPE